MGIKVFQNVRTSIERIEQYTCRNYYTITETDRQICVSQNLAALSAVLRSRRVTGGKAEAQATRARARTSREIDVIESTRFRKMTSTNNGTNGSWKKYEGGPVSSGGVCGFHSR